MSEPAPPLSDATGLIAPLTAIFPVPTWRASVTLIAGVSGVAVTAGEVAVAEPVVSVAVTAHWIARPTQIARTLSVEPVPIWTWESASCQASVNAPAPADQVPLLQVSVDPYELAPVIDGSVAGVGAAEACAAQRPQAPTAAPAVRSVLSRRIRASVAVMAPRRVRRRGVTARLRTAPEGR